MRPSKIDKVVPAIGEGIYFPVDVATILRLNYTKVRHMMNTFWKDYTFGERGNRAINFYSMIEFYTYFRLRERDYTSNHVKSFHKILCKTLHTQYPFASIKILDPTNKKTKKSKIWYEYHGEIMRDDRAIQPTIAEFIKPFFKNVRFDENDIASHFFPFDHTENIVVDPSHQFGQPVIAGTNIQAKTIFSLSKAGETNKNICELYEINDNQVSDAIRLYSRLTA